MEALNSNCNISIHRTRSSLCFANRNNFIDLSSYKCFRSSKIFSKTSLLAWSKFNTKKIYMGAVLARQQANNDVQSSAAVPGPPSGQPWRNWLVGAILSLVIPFVSNKWGRLLALKNGVETAVNTVETVAETVEKVAEEVAHVADEVANQLPEGGSMQNIVCNIANVAEETAKDAHLVDQYIEKVEDMEKDLVSTFVGGTQHTKVGIDEVANDNNVHPNEELEQKHQDTNSPIEEVAKDEIIDETKTK